jgi:hypothetical protein
MYVSIPMYLFSSLSRPALGPTQPPSHWVLGVKRPGHEAGQSPYLVPRLGMSGAILSLPSTASWRAQG